MCHIWKNPTHPIEEVSVRELEKLPKGFDNLNITGGEPTLRKDLYEIVTVLYRKARILEISSNGLHADKLEPIVRKYPAVKIRFSVEAFGGLNDRIRGEPQGFETKLKGLRRLRELGGKDLGFATVIQDDNAHQLLELYRFAMRERFEFSTSALHNAFQFHKNDNYPYDRLKLAKELEKLITEMLSSDSIKNWFRAYLNLGLIKKILGQDRLIACTAATDFVFVDPWSDVYACNVRPDLLMGNLQQQTWAEIMSSEVASSIRLRVAACTQNCWMVTTARTAMRNPHIPQLPKMGPLTWVLKNKLKLIIGRSIDLRGMIDYSLIHKDGEGPKRQYYLNQVVKRTLQYKDQPHYQQGEFFNK